MNPWILTVYLTAFAGDAGTTAYALQHQGHEVVLPSQSPVIVSVLAAGEAGLGIWAYRRLKPEHPKLATVVWFSLTAAHGSAAIWNARQLAKGR